MSISKKWLKVLLPPLCIIGAIIVSSILVSMKPEQERKDPVAIHPKIEVHRIKGKEGPLILQSEGTVRPRQQTRLTARVSGHIEEVSPVFYEGGTFKKGDVLLGLDPLPYRDALAEAEARMALAEAALIQEKEAAKQARRDWEAMGSGETPNPLVLREPQLMRAEAELKASRTAHEVAQLNLDYTQVRAPYDGRVEAKFVDVGQAITAQATILGEIHSSGSLEVPVPLSMNDFSFITDYKEQGAAKPSATLSARINGTDNFWKGVLDRTSASVNPQSRMITAIIEATPPFKSANGIDLRPGMFVQVEIEGKQFQNLLLLPRSALHPGNMVYRLAPGNRLESRAVKVLYTSEEMAVVSEGIEADDLVCLTPLLFFVEGMQVVPEKVPEDNEESGT